MTILTKHGAQLSASFSEEDAHAFARFLREREISAHVSRLMNMISGEPTDWYRVAVPKRLLQRAEDMRAGWEGRAAWNFDRSSAERDTLSEYADETTREEYAQATVRLAQSVAAVGLTDARRGFLEDAAEGDASPWDHASSAVSFCKRLGYVRPVKVGGSTRYAITDEGRAALALDPLEAQRTG